MCDKVILQSPWMPMITSEIDEVLSQLSKKHIEVMIICGKEDHDCMPPLCKIFEEKARASKLELKLETHYIKNLGHEYPDNFTSLVKGFIEK